MSEGAERLEATFRSAGRPLFIPYVMGGYPDPDTSAAHAALLARHADVIELGMPFSDPLADGPTIQAAGQRALRAGTRPETVLEIAASLRGGPPVVLMTYVNVVLAAGPRAFFERAAKAGVAGVIVPDLPIDEGEDLRAAADRAGIATVPLAAPTTDDARLARIGRRAEGFVYCVAVTGVTGGETAVDADLRDFISRARRQIAAPLAVGFGVRSPAQAAAIGAFADGVVMASALVRLVEDAPDPASAETAIDRLAGEVRAALEGVPAPAG
ncbi:MAG: tryptophan synthase alpha chain [Miltoncostaeaceae bacterium]|jgi:tryptophan synthase alpha chain|nr:tryptophan synthase alpha chain [Miltoncostaeaceae bacterium]